LIRNAELEETKKEGVVLQRGQLITSYVKIAEALHWRGGKGPRQYSKATIGNAFRLLREYKAVTTASTTGVFVVTIVKFDFYQDPKNYVYNSTYNAATPAATPEKEPPKQFSEDVETMFAFFCKELEVAPKSDANGIDWRHAIRKTIDLDKRDKKEMCRLIRWVSQAIEEPRPGSTWTGWRAVIKSPAKFRAQYDVLLDRMKTAELARQNGQPKREATITSDLVEQML
jgi:hypothetical protein